MLSAVAAWCVAPVLGAASIVQSVAVATHRTFGRLVTPVVLFARVLQLFVCAQVIVLAFVVANVMYNKVLFALFEAQEGAVAGLRGRGIGELVQTVLYGPSAPQPVVL